MRLNKFEIREDYWIYCNEINGLIKIWRDRIMAFKLGIGTIGAYILIITVLFSFKIIDEKKYTNTFKKGYYAIWKLICLVSIIELWGYKENAGKFLIGSIIVIAFCILVSTMLCTLAIEGKGIEDYTRKIVIKIKKILTLK